MKIRVLAYGINARHDLVHHLGNLFGDICISDFDAFAFDAGAVADVLRSQGRPNNQLVSSVTDTSGAVRSLLFRHVREVTELIQRKGGVVIALMDENDFTLHAEYSTPNGARHTGFGPYFLIEDALGFVNKEDLMKSIIGGQGTRIQISPTVGCNYLRALRDNLQYFAKFVSAEANLLSTVFATDTVGHVVAAELKVGNGSIVFLPKYSGADAARFGAAIVQTVRERVSSETPDVTPSWVEGIAVPGSQTHNDELAQLRERQRITTENIRELESAQTELLNHRRLLYTTGKHILEPAVRKAFRLIGFDVLDPDSYDGEWDLEMQSPEGTLFIGEVEGPEGSVDVDKFRQALNYHTDQVVAGRPNKGLLVGNAHRLKQPTERADFFTGHAVRASEPMRMALIPTTALFAAVCDVLASNEPELKKSIRESITNCVGVWQWPSLGSDAAEGETDAPDHE